MTVPAAAMGENNASNFVLLPETTIEDDTIKVVVVAAVPEPELMVTASAPDVLSE
jgi:hypothetical protein